MRVGKYEQVSLEKKDRNEWFGRNHTFHYFESQQRIKDIIHSVYSYKKQLKINLVIMSGPLCSCLISGWNSWSDYMPLFCRDIKTKKAPRHSCFPNVRCGPFCSNNKLGSCPIQLRCIIYLHGWDVLIASSVRHIYMAHCQ